MDFHNNENKLNLYLQKKKEMLDKALSMYQKEPQREIFKAKN